MTGLYCRCGCKVCRVPDTRHCGGLPNCGVPRARGPASGTAVPARTRQRPAEAQYAPAGLLVIRPR
ncbi:MAG: hypothetical protein U0237_11600 [Thermoleophilia bacterium]